MNEQTKKDIDRAFKALEALDEIKTKITKIRDSWERNNYHDKADVLTLVLIIIDECVEVIEGV